LARCPRCGLLFTVLEGGLRKIREAYKAGLFPAPVDDRKRVAVWRGRI